MASTHQQLLYHIVFSTKNRKPYLANEDHRGEVFAYMAGIAKNLKGFALEIGGWVDHAHLLVRIPAMMRSNTTRDTYGNDMYRPSGAFEYLSTITGA